MIVWISYTFKRNKNPFSLDRTLGNCGTQRHIGGGKVIERYPLIWCLLYNKTRQHLVSPSHCYDHLEDKLGLDGHSHVCAWKAGDWVALVLSHNSTVLSGVFVGSNIRRAAEKSGFYAQVFFFSREERTYSILQITFHHQGKPRQDAWRKETKILLASSFLRSRSATFLI